MDIDIYSDVVCPWCYIGKRRLDTALAGFEGKATIRYQPFQLDPGAAREGRPLLASLASKFGGAERARQITAHTAEVAATDGIEMHFDRAIAANTFDAHRLVWFAGDDLAPALVEALHRAHFTEGGDIGDPEVLVAVAASAGLDADRTRSFLASSDGVAEVSELIDQARRLGITSVPTFVFAGTYAVSGAQDPQVLLQVLQEVERRESPLQPVTVTGPACDDEACDI